MNFFVRYVFGMDKKSFVKYFLKNAQGSLIPRTEGELIELIQGKSVKGETKVFSTQFNKWVKLKELNVYKNRSLLNTNDTINNLEALPSNEKPNHVRHADYISLLDQVEDARAFAFKAQFENSDKLQKLEVENEKLKEKIRFLEYSNKEETSNKDHYLNEYEKLQSQLKEINKTLKFDKHDTELTKAKSEVKNLQSEIKFLENEVKSQTEFKNKLMIQNEELKSDIISYHESKEQIETENNKIKNERKFYLERLETYKDEIERLSNEVHKKRALFRKVSDKYEEDRELYSRHKYIISDLEADNEHLKRQATNSLNQLDKVQQLNHQITEDLVKFQAKSYEQEIEIQKLTTENTYMSGNIELLTNQKKTLEEKVTELHYTQPLPEDRISKTEHENILDLHEHKSEELGSKVNILESEISELKKEIISLQKEKDELHSKNEEIINKKNKDIEYIKSRAQKLLQKKKQLEAVAKKQKVIIKKLTEVKNAAIKKYGDRVQDFNSKLVEAQKEIAQEKNKNQEIMNNISQLNNVNSNDVEIDNLLNQQQDIANNEILADEESIGELFELSNEELWSVRFEGEIHGPHTFLEVKQMLQDRDIDEETTVKKPGSPWKKISDIFEFNTEVMTKTDENDEVHLYIKRDDLRIPLFEDVLMTINNQEFNGKCTNLSSGGCYIESSAFNNKLFKVGEELRIEFTGDGAHKGLQLNTILRSLSKDIPPGAGFQFVDMNNDKLKKLDHFFTKFSKTFSHKSAA